MRIPADAFVIYAGMGERRSYGILAQRLQVSKRSIAKRASREGWQQKLHEMERRANEDALARLGEDVAAIRERHLKTMRIVQAKALETLKTKPLETAMDAVRALALAQREERELVGAQQIPGSVVGFERRVREVSERSVVAMDAHATVSEQCPTIHAFEEADRTRD